jgi:hypothetical protein
MKTRGKLGKLAVLAIMGCLLFGLATLATGQSDPTVNSTIVPRLIRFGGLARDLNSKPLTGTIGITFALYKDQEGGASLWTETQNVQPDAKGNYTVQLGATQPDGMPTNIFASGEARWLGVQISGQSEQSRVLLLAVPYAMKAADAETIGGLPASAFMRANPESSSESGSSAAENGAGSAIAAAGGSGALKESPQANKAVTTPGGKAGYFPLFTSASVVADSNLFQSASGAYKGDVGIGTAAPGSVLTVEGATNWGQIEIVGPSSAEASIGFRPSNVGKGGSGDWLIGTNTDASPAEGFAIQNAEGPSLLDIDASGNVYIGTNALGPGVHMAGGLEISGSGDSILVGQFEGINSFAVNPDPTSSGAGWTLWDNAAATWTPGITQERGNVSIAGNLSKAGGSFKIDHPLDPANKYLYHSFVESPDMMNIYNGSVTTDTEGNATIQMPDWFDALNRDFRYQLTVIGQPAQAYVSQELANRQFSIKTDKSNVKVSWQITGIRQDAWANAHRIPVEVAKPAGERGLYLHPELFGAPADKGIAAHHSAMTQTTKQLQQTHTTSR